MQLDKIVKADKILIFDFGSQTTHLIGRRLRDLGIETEIKDSETAIREIKKIDPAGVILSGGPTSVYDKSAPSIDKRIFNLGIPVLGICYGWQLTAFLLDGEVKSGFKEYGPANLKININGALFEELDSFSRVWVSHGDTVVKNPPGFITMGETETVKNAACANFHKKIFGIQFHPEVDHTVFGTEILKNFAQRICGLKIKKREINIKKIIAKIKKEIGTQKAICAISGGVDSTTAALLVGKAIGKNLYPTYIESGLMREGTREEVKDIFQKFLKMKPIIVEAKKIFLKKLKGVIDPEEKRKIIGGLYVSLFEKEAKKLKGIKFLVQGTIYSDVIESKGTKRADKIKSHHNVGGLPEKMNLKLVEPLRFFYKDEVREIARKLGLPPEITNKQVFPGPGQAIRIIGEVTWKRLKKQQAADKIVFEEIKKAGFYEKVFMCFPVLTGTNSTAVKGDARQFFEVVALRVVESKDVMTTDWSKLPYGLLQKISSRIVNEVSGVSRVVYDITTKPPATMEWQ
jgi:GMP synthase (glutamine-hydrolysing)